MQGHATFQVVIEQNQTICCTNTLQLGWGRISVQWEYQVVRSYVVVRTSSEAYLFPSCDYLGLVVYRFVIF